MSTRRHPDRRPQAPIQDETAQRVSLGEFARQRVAALREGELGSLPIVLGIIVIAIYFQARNSNFLTAGNFVNLIAQMAAIMIIGTGIVFVLLLGEIDLSVGYVSGMGGVIAALLLEPGKGVPTSVALALALGTGVAIGLLQGFFVARVGVPSFVVTLAGLLGWNGVLLQIIGSSGTIVIQNSLINGIANEYMSAALSWIVAIALVAAYAFQGLSNVYRRRQAGLPNRSVVVRDRTDRDPRDRRDRRRRDRRLRPRAAVRHVDHGRQLRDLDVRRRADPLRPPHLRRRRECRGGTASRNQRREHQDRRVRDLGLHGGARRASCSRRG